MRVRLLFTGKTEAGHVAEGLAFYLERIGRSAKVDVAIVPESKRKEPEAKRKEEADAILRALRPAERLVLLDERGTALTSAAFAQRLGALRDQGVRDIAFLVGGAYGVDDVVRQRATLMLSLSPMTFPHQLVRVLFAEQLYRAFSILEGRPYHH